MPFHRVDDFVPPLHVEPTQTMCDLCGKHFIYVSQWSVPMYCQGCEDYLNYLRREERTEHGDLA